jgi:hypothetical protein
MKHASESNANYAQALTGIEFPATRDQLVEQAKKNGADQHIIDVLSAMPDDEPYNIMPDVFMNTREGKDAVAAKEAKGSNKH